MRSYFSSVAEAQKSYPNYVPVTSQKKCVHHHHYYTKMGKIPVTHHADWKAQRIFMSVCLAAVAITFIPLFIKPYRKLVGKLWNQGLSGNENISIYIVTGDAPSSSSKSKTSSKVMKLIQQIEKGELDHNSKKLQSLTKKEIALISSLKVNTLKEIFPFTLTTKEDAALKDRLSHLNEKVICKLVEEGQLDFDSHILRALSHKHLNSLTKLNKLTFIRIFPNPFSDQKKNAQLKDRLSHLNEKVVCELVEAGTLNSESHILQALSQKHLSALTKLTKNTLTAILPNPYGNSEKALDVKTRLGWLNKDFVCKLVEHEMLNKEYYLLRALSKEHLGNLSKLSASTLESILASSSNPTERYSQLPWNLVRALIEGNNDLSSSCLLDLPEEWLKMTDFSKISSHQMKLFLNFFNEDKHEKFFAKLTPNQLQTVKAKLNESEMPKSNPSYSSGPSFDPFNDPFFNFFFNNGGFNTNPTTTGINIQEAYKILGLPDAAPLEEVKKKYKILALKHHPDKVQKEENETEENFKKRQTESEEFIKKLNEAYATLLKKP